MRFFKKQIGGFRNSGAPFDEDDCVYKDPCEEYEYECPKCGGKMKPDNMGNLECTSCGYTMDFDQYGLEDWEYDEMCPTEEEVLERDRENSGEYDEDDE